jgi:hypothetical protein
MLRSPARAFTAAILLAVCALAGCDGLLSTNNPNDLIEEDLEDPTSARALANGSIVTTSRAYGYMYALHGIASDELYWIGSYDAWNQMDFGFINNPLNQFVGVAFPFVGEARWTADNAIDRIEEFRENGELEDDLVLAQAYHYGALSYLLVGDFFENFALSSKGEAGEPIGPANMKQLYDTAIGYLDNALQIARSQNATDMEAMVLATRARAKHGRAVWEVLNPPGEIPDGSYVGPEGAVADARSYFELVGETADEEYQFLFGPSSVVNYVADQVNNRQEMAVTDIYANLSDPVSGEPDPRTAALVERFTEGQYAPITYTSSREMHLILAEAALVEDDQEEAVRHINLVRETSGLPPYGPATSELSVAQMLEYERKANLFMMGRRLHDLYRFGEQAPRWNENAPTVQAPGTVFPVSEAERDANPNF